MRVVKIKTLSTFWALYPDTEGPLQAWYHHASAAQWSKPDDVKKDYADASILSNNRVVFNIKGNQYRLVVAIHYKSQIIFIRFMGTHAQYDRIDSTRI